MKDLAEVMEGLKDVKCIKQKFVECMLSQISVKGIEGINTEDAKEAVDIIKDLADAEKDCMEALYYQKVIEAMVSYDQPRYGYTPNRSSKTGRFISGPGPKMGYMPHERFTEYDGDMSPDDYMNESMMGYHNNPEYVNHMDQRYGKAYNDYKMTRRNYTKTGSKEDLKEMNVHAEEHIKDSIATIRDIWSDADPSLKKRMKEDLMTLMNDMVI